MKGLLKIFSTFRHVWFILVLKFFLLFYLLFDITKPLFFCTLVSCNRAQPICHCANVGAAASLHSTVRDTGHTIAWIYVASESLLSGQDKPCPWAVECVMRRFNLPVVSRINSINFFKDIIYTFLPSTLCLNLILNIDHVKLIFKVDVFFLHSPMTFPTVKESDRSRNII